MMGALANNISARQIRDEYARRQQEAAQHRVDEDEGDEDEQQMEEDSNENDSATLPNRLTRGRSDILSRAISARKLENAKKPSLKKKKKSGKRKGSDSNDNESDDEFNDARFGLGRHLYAKAKKLPGQFANCETCEKRFTVTAYSKTGPNGGLVCSPCGKMLDKDVSSGKKPVLKPKNAIKRRRQTESERMDGVVRRGAKPLLRHCIETVTKHHDQLESLENVPAHVMSQICKLFSKERAINSNTIPLFYGTELSELCVYDCAQLQLNDFSRMFAELPRLESLTLGHVAQFKDANIDYMIDKAKCLRHLKLSGANLVSSEKWSELWRVIGSKLESIQLQWLDAAFTDKQVADMAHYCPNITRLKLEHCWLIGPEALTSIASMTQLKHLSLRFIQVVPNEHVAALIKRLGHQLETLSLRSFTDLDDSVLDSIHQYCLKLKKLRISDNDMITDAAWANLFSNWNNPPLTYVDVSAVRDTDNLHPDGQLQGELIGFSDRAFAALMAHSATSIRHLDISSCRHISLQALLTVFELGASFPKLENIDFSFVQHIDDVALAGLFHASRESLKKVALFGCFAITSDRMVPKGVVVVGAPCISHEDGMEVWGNTAGIVNTTTSSFLQSVMEVRQQDDVEMVRYG